MDDRFNKYIELNREYDGAQSQGESVLDNDIFLGKRNASGRVVTSDGRLPLFERMHHVQQLRGPGRVVDPFAKKM